MAAERGLILVDTKYEFGKLANGTIVLIDEIHTPDSSRYFYSQGYTERQKSGAAQLQLSKEFVREWLMENGFQGKENQKVPTMTDEFVHRINRYRELFEKLQKCISTPLPTKDSEFPIKNNIEKYLVSARKV